MRSIVAERLQITINERSIDIEELKTVDELFLTNSLVGIQPVQNLLGRALAQDLTSSLQESLLRYISHISP